MSKKILFIEGNVDGTVGGSYYVLYDIVTHIDKMKYIPIVGFHEDNYLIDELNTKGIKAILFDNPPSFVFKIDVLNQLLSPLKKLINFFKKFILPAYRYAKFLRNEKIDLVNLNNSITRNHTWALACIIANVKCMTHEMGINHNFSFPSKFFGKRMKSIIPVSHAVHDYMKLGGVGYPNVEVIHNGIDVERYQSSQTPHELRNIYKILDSDPVIGIVGNIKHWKGQETLVSALFNIKKEFPSIKCFLVGKCAESDSQYLEKLSTIIKELGLEDNVIFTGFQRNAIDYMSLMDIVIHTSVEPEPFGIVTLEAMYLSKPYISTSIGGPTEVVVDNETGILVDPGDSEKLASAVIKLLKKPQLAKEFGVAGNKRLYEKFTLEMNIERLSNIYDKIFKSE